MKEPSGITQAQLDAIHAQLMQQAPPAEFCEPCSECMAVLWEEMEKEGWRELRAILRKPRKKRI